ncbi:hypothetical protein SAMN05216378_0407 [Paenibacillus catalpae]|uniref:Uncharacterized protein n=1 Tax=Paenibacillus catalpae TaxID=1045775 RepID=A0A1I1T8D9_9BACL|nr:hypothetical protein [Paenibacillus catalpae]SFD54907.1 hypothetical protein SAMN05216378_0407 [Paenibacillus catalpae]
MSKKSKMTVLFAIAVIFICSCIVIRRSGEKGMERAALSLHQPMTTIAQVEKLDKNDAIVFYEWINTGEEYFGMARVKKNLFGWHFVGGSTSAESKYHKFGWSYSDLEGATLNYKGIYYGKIFDPEIERMTLKSRAGSEYSCQIIQYRAGERFWFILTDKVEQSDSVVIARSQDGEILGQYPSF